MTDKILLVIVSILFGVGIGYWSSSFFQEWECSEDRVTDVVEDTSEPPKPRLDTPKRIVEYKTDTTYVDTTTCYRAPARYEKPTIASDRPVKVIHEGLFSEPSVIYSYYNPRTRSYEAAEYTVERSNWRYGVQVQSGFYTRIRPYLDAAVYGGYKNFEAMIGYRISEPITAPYVGVRWRIGR